MSHNYGTSPKDFTIGQRVELHPGTDLWMMGARFGTVTKIGRKFVTVKLDRLTRAKRFSADLLRFVE